MPAACDKCGKETKVEEAFYKVQRPGSGEVRRRCPECWLKAQKNDYRDVLSSLLVVGTVAVGLILTKNPIGWFFLSLIALYSLMPFAALPHELGHAFAAKAAGFRAFYVIIGFGRTIFERTFCGFKFQLKSIPFGGFAISAPKNTDGYRFKRCLMILAGPLANLAVAGLLALLMPKQAFDFNFTNGIQVVNLFFIANLACFVWSLWPCTIRTAYGEIPNDGLLIWKTLFLSKEAIEKTPLHYYLYEGNDFFSRNQLQEAKVWFEKGLEKFPKNISLLNAHGSILLRLKRFSEARAVFVTLLERPGMDPLHRSLVANNLAYVNTLIGGEDLIQEADKYSKEALESLPFHPNYKGTRGCVLVELGKFKEGMSLLKEAMEQAETKRSKALGACHIAIAERRRGNLEESQKFATIARSLDADCMLLDRIA